MIITNIKELQEVLQKSLYENKVINGDDVISDVLGFYEKKNPKNDKEFDEEYHCWDYLHGVNKL